MFFSSHSSPPTDSRNTVVAPYARFAPQASSPLRAAFHAPLVLVLLTSLLPASQAQSGPFDRPPRNWAVEAAKNEIPIVEYNGIYLRYRVHIIGAKGDQVRDVVESRDGSVARLVARDNRPLTTEEDSAEHQRLQDMLDSPSAFARHIKGDLSGKKLAVDLVKLMPDAMLFNYAPGQPQRASSPRGAPEIVLDFQPNPAWNPSTITSEALTGFRGRLWIDRQTQHVTRMEGEVFRGVGLGWGMIAHINPGGTVMLEQVAVPLAPPDQRWIFSHFIEHVSLRALMVKNITENSEIESSSYVRISPISYQEAIKLLLDTPLPR